jgi:hypothetical protein
MTARDVRIGDHTVRVVYDRIGRHGVFDPHVNFHLTGPNGSPAGRGPKGWPRWTRPAWPYYARRHRWSSVLTLPLPHLKWSHGYRARRIGGLRLAAIVERLYP